MNDIPTYNHSKPDLEPEFKPSFCHYAAKISILAPILSLIFLKSLAYGFADVKPPWGVLITVGLSFLLAFIFLVSLVLALIALTGMPRYGKEGILGRALAGLLVSTVLLAFWGAGFVHGFKTALQNRQAANAVTQAATEVHDNLKKELAEKGTIGPDSVRSRSEKMKSALDKASREMTGDVALVAKAGSAYTAKMQSLLTDYTAALRAMKSPPVLEMKGVDQREQLEGKKELVKKFMEANEKLMAFYTKAESVFRDELVRAKVPVPTFEAALKEYRQNEDERNYLAVKIRMTDQRIGTALLGALDILDGSWGDWKYNPENKSLIFKDTTVIAKYNNYVGEMNSAAQEQAQLQGEYVKLPATASVQ